MDGISGTGYHPPLMGFMTALLWKILGYRLWVSHVFVLFWACVLIYNVRKLIQSIFPEKFTGWILAIVLLESTLLTQFVVASPDFILFTAFILSLRAVLEQRKLLLAVGVFFLCCINMRGVFVGAILFLVHNYYFYLKSGRYSFKAFCRQSLPYLPTLLILVVYFSLYLNKNGWFFDSSSGTGHYAKPTSFMRILKHVAEFGLRSIENGRIIIWIFGVCVAVKTFKQKKVVAPEIKALVLMFLSLNGLYVIFIVISQMPFPSRYFMPQFFLLTLLSLYGIIYIFDVRREKLFFIVILLFELTGHLWIYPEKIAKAWDGTLAHIPYYELREDCLKYIEGKGIDYRDVSAGFCLYGDRRLIDLQERRQVIASGDKRKYFIYSNISNVDDSFADSLRNQYYWIPLKRFDKGFVSIVVYKRK